MTYYVKTPDRSFRRKTTKSGLEELGLHESPKKENIGKHWKTSEYIKRVQDIRDKEMDETPTGVSRS